MVCVSPVSGPQVHTSIISQGSDRVPDTAGHLHLSLCVDCFVVLLCQWPHAGEDVDGRVAANDRPQHIPFLPCAFPALSPMQMGVLSTGCSFFGIGGCWLEQRRKGKGYLLPQF